MKELGRKTLCVTQGATVLRRRRRVSLGKRHPSPRGALPEAGSGVPTVPSWHAFETRRGWLARRFVPRGLFDAEIGACGQGREARGKTATTLWFPCSRRVKKSPADILRPASGTPELGV